MRLLFSQSFKGRREKEKETVEIHVLRRRSRLQRTSNQIEVSGPKKTIARRCSLRFVGDTGEKRRRERLKGGFGVLGRGEEENSKVAKGEESLLLVKRIGKVKESERGFSRVVT